MHLICANFFCSFFLICIKLYALHLAYFYPLHSKIYIYIMCIFHFIAILKSSHLKSFHRKISRFTVFILFRFVTVSQKYESTLDIYVVYMYAFIKLQKNNKPKYICICSLRYGHIQLYL